MTPGYGPLWYWVRQRELIRVRKEAGWEPKDWHFDPILLKYRFCNVRREDDRGTVWIRENIRKPFVNHPYLWLMLCIARQINWPATLAELMRYEGAWPYDEDFDPWRMGYVLNCRRMRGEKIYTGAYMISAPARKGANKQAYIAEDVCGALWRSLRRHPAPKDGTLQEAHQWLTSFNGWGNFMAYQAVVDMRFTKILGSASDIHSWAAAGPGTLRGLNRLYDRPLTQPLSQERALDEMRDIYDKVLDETGVTCDFSDVPNMLCETDKYLRVLSNEGEPRTLYVPGRGS